MKILITGGTGFIGKNLADALVKKGHHIISINSPSYRGPHKSGKVTHMVADTTREGAWQKKVEEVDAVINLAGKTIFRRWTEKYKKQIYDSRILTTRNIVNAIPSGKKQILLSASAAGYYGCRGEESLTENASCGDDFLARVSKDWEKEAARAPSDVRVVNTRFGVVMGRGGGAAAKMIPAFSMYLGGPIGNGNQWFPWIHLADLIQAAVFLLENPLIHGPVNLVSKAPVRNRELSRALGSVLGKPFALAVPSFVVRKLMGEFGDTLLCSQRVIPERLLEHNYHFLYPEIKDALLEITGNR